MDLDNIKYLLGHSITKDNIQYYLKQDQRKIRAVRKALTDIENEIYKALEERKSKAEEKEKSHAKPVNLEDNKEPHSLHSDEESGKVSIDHFIQLTKTNPQLAQKLAENNLVAM